MHDETLFRGQIAKIRRWNVIRILHGILLNASLIYLTLNVFYFGLQTAGITGRTSDGWWHAGCGGFSLLLGAAIGLSLKQKLPQVLIEIDRRLGLRDRFSTAYEYFRYHPDNVFTGLLIRDAARALQSFKMQHIMPMALSRRHWAAVALLMLNIFLYSEVWEPTGRQWSDQEGNNIETAAKLLQDYSIRSLEKREGQSPAAQSKAGEKLARHRRSLQDRSKTVEQQVQSMRQYRKEIQGERASLTDELGRKLEAAEIKPGLTPKITPSENLSAAHLEKLRKFLNETFNNRIPDSLNRDIETPQELYRIEDLVSRIIENFETDRAMAGVSNDALENEKQDHRSTDLDPSQRNDRSEEEADRPHAERNPMAPGSPGSPNSRKPGLDDGSPGGKPDQPGANSAAAGKGTSDAGKESADELQDSGGVLARETIAAAPAKNYLIQIRSLTEIGDAQLSAEEIFKSYRKAIESVLQKEDIPSNYREYIKNYFHSIGIKTEN